MEDKKTRTTKKIDLLTSVESIVYLAKESKLNKEFYRKADKYLKYMSEKLELTKDGRSWKVDPVTDEFTDALLGGLNTFLESQD